MTHPVPAEPGVSADPAFLRLLSRMPSDIVWSLTGEQLRALAEAARERDNPAHTVDFLVSLPCLGRRYYLRLSFGREKRSLERLMKEGQISLPRTVLVWSVVAWMAVSLLAVGTVLALYLLKSVLGLNLMKGQSPLHSVYELVFRAWA